MLRAWKSFPGNNSIGMLKSKNIKFLYFFIGFILSAILAVSAYLLTYGMWMVYSEENESRRQDGVPPSVSSLKTQTSPDDVCHRRVVGYYTHWERAPLALNQLDKLTHIIYMFGFIQTDGSVSFDYSNTTSLEKRWLDMKKTISRAGKRDLKVMIAVGDHFSANQFESAVAYPEIKEQLLTSICDLLDKYDIDGIEVHWTFPFSRDAGVQHAQFIKELRQSMTKLKNVNGRSENYVLSTVSSRVKRNRENILYNVIMNDVDFVSVLPYDWTNTLVGPTSPLYGFDEDSMDEAIRDLTCKTKMPSKINLGVDIFGVHWQNVSFPFNDETRQMYTPNNGGQTSHSYIFGRDNHFAGAWIYTEPLWHNTSRTPYIWDAKDRVFVSFENERSLEEKSSYAWMKNLGGMTVYVLEQDPKNIMIDAASSVEKCLRLKKDSVQFDCST